jgi:hypothetical protein
VKRRGLVRPCETRRCGNSTNRAPPIGRAVTPGRLLHGVPTVSGLRSKRPGFYWDCLPLRRPVMSSGGDATQSRSRDISSNLTIATGPAFLRRGFSVPGLRLSALQSKRPVFCWDCLFRLLSVLSSDRGGSRHLHESSGGPPVGGLDSLHAVACSYSARGRVATVSWRWCTSASSPSPAPQRCASGRSATTCA